MNKNDFAKRLETFLYGTGKAYDFDDLVSSPYEDPELEEFRIELIDLPTIFPPEEQGSYTSRRGLQRIRKMAEELKT